MNISQAVCLTLAAFLNIFLYTWGWNMAYRAGRRQGQKDACKTHDKEQP